MGRQQRYQEGRNTRRNWTAQEDLEKTTDEKQDNRIKPTAPPIGSKRMNRESEKKGSYEYQKNWGQFLPVGGTIMREPQKQRRDMTSGMKNLSLPPTRMKRK